MPKRKAQAPPAGSAVAKPKVQLDPSLELDDAAADPVVLFSHGAGAGCSHPWMQKWRNLLMVATNAKDVHCIDYPYMQGGKSKVAPKAEKLVGFHEKEMEQLREKYPGRPLILAGKSMGSRVSCMVAGKEGTPAAAVICLGYPLKGMNSSVRDKPLLDLKAPVIFVQGSKDAMCPLKYLEQVRQKMSVETAVHEVEDGDHSLTCGVRKLKDRGMDQDAVDQQAVASIKTFIRGVLKMPN